LDSPAGSSLLDWNKAVEFSQAFACFYKLFDLQIESDLSDPRSGLNRLMKCYDVGTERDKE